MKIDDAIKFFEEAAKASARLGTEKLELGAVAHIAYDTYSQIAEWLKELKQIRTIDAVNEWIPCSERLPEERGIYLCTVGAPYRNPREMQYAPQEWADKSDNATWRNTNGSYVYDWLVEAWQPLPKPWKGAEYE